MFLLTLSVYIYIYIHTHTYTHTQMTHTHSDIHIKLTHTHTHTHTLCVQGRIQDFHLGGGGGAKNHVPARTVYERGTELTFGRGPGLA